MKAYVNFGPWGGPYETKFLGEVKVKPLWWQKQGLSETASGYGSKLTTQYMVKYEGIWRRVYATCYSNASTTYIMVGGRRCVVNLLES